MSVFAVDRSDILLVILFLSMAGCSPKNHPTSPAFGGSDLRDYIPLKVGYSWTYSGSSQLSNGLIDTAKSSSLVLSVFKTNTLIGGQPNAFVIAASGGAGPIQYLAFFLDPTTLWHYLGGTIALQIQTNLILWIPGGVGGALVGVSQSQTYRVTDRSENEYSFAIQRPPDPSVALARMTSQDTVQITGVSEGNTTFCLQRIGGGAADTMTVLVETTKNSNPTIPLLRPWIPLWQLTNSSADQIVFSWDTTYSFRRLSDSALCRDDLSYLVTNRRIGGEVIPALNASMNCDKFEMNVIVTETVTYTDKLGSQVLYQGPSSRFVVDVWLTKGIGFIKGTIDGTSLFPGVTMAGTKDSNEVLRGYYVSPRVSYAAFAGSSSTTEYFNVDVAPLGPNSTSQAFILTKKNF